MVKLNDNNAYKRGQELLDSGLFAEAIAQFDEFLANLYNGAIINISTIQF